MNAEPGRSARWPTRVAVLLMAVGAVLRIRRVAAARSLWLDEAWLALNVMTRSFVALTHRLDFEQVAPVPFLWSVRAITRLFGHGEVALRLFPLMGGMLLPIVSWPLFRRLLGAGWGLVALALAAFSPVLVYYSDELKPYGWDASATALVLLLTLRLVEQQRRSDWVWLALGGTVALVCSFTAVFPIAAALVAIVLTVDVRGTRLHRNALAACLAAWGTAYLCTSAITLRRGAWSPYMRRYWARAFLGGSEPDPVGRAWTMIGEPIHQNLVSVKLPHPDAQSAVMLGVLAIGLVALFRTATRAQQILIAGPPMLMIVASLLALYPFSSRLTLFLMPCFLVLMCGAVRWAATLSRRPWVQAVVGVMLTLPWVETSTERFIDPYRREDFAAVYRQLVHHRAPGTPLYIYSRALPTWTFYSTDWAHPDEERLQMEFRIESADGPSFANGASVGHVENAGEDLVWQSGNELELYGLNTGAQYLMLHETKQVDPGWAQNELGRIRRRAPHDVWLIFTHSIDSGERELTTALDRSGGHREEVIREPGASAYHFRFDGAHPTAASAPVQAKAPEDAR